MLDMNKYSTDTMHWGGSFSCTEIVAVLYHHVLSLNGDYQNRDVFLLSKGHAALCVYSVMYLEKLLDDRQLKTYQDDGSHLSEIMEYDPEYGFETSGGSLGNNVSYGVGVALLAKKKGYLHRTYVLVGDGEIDEGAVWEAIMSASQFGLDNLVLIIDSNRLQSDGFTKEIMSWDDLSQRLKSFGWKVFDIDGHDCRELIDAFENSKKEKAPVAIIANTVKGKGVSFMENDYTWHDKKMRPEELSKALSELEALRDGS